MIKTLTKVNSSMIYAVGYDPEEEFENLMKSKSLGSYMRSNIIGCYSDFLVS